MASTVAQLVTQAKASIENLNPEEAFTEYESGVALFVDIRDSEERKASGAIPKSHHAPRGMIEFYADPTSPYHREEFDPNRRIVLYCASGGRSALTALALRQLGYTNLAHVDGGIKAWQAAGLPVADGHAR